jgi:hypothetical protein
MHSETVKIGYIFSNTVPRVNKTPIDFVIMHITECFFGTFTAVRVRFSFEFLSILSPVIKVASF